jgi:hypothetical protein
MTNFLRFAEIEDFTRMELSLSPDVIESIDRALAIHPELSEENRESFIHRCVRYALSSLSETQPTV